MAHIPTDEYVPGAWNAICDRCGRKRKSTELRKTWDNLYVCSEHWEPRHPQDFVRSRVDQQAPDWIRPPGECPPLCPIITLSGSAAPALGVPNTYYYSGTQVTYARAYTLASSVDATMTPTSVTIGPGATTGSVQVTFSEEGPQVLYLVADDGCETGQLAVVVGPGASATPSFYGLVSSGTASYTITNQFAGSFDPSTPLDASALEAVFEAQALFVAASGAGTPYTFESESATADGTLLESFADATSGVVVTVSAVTGQIASVTAGTTDGGGRYSVPYTVDGLTPIPADGGSKFLRVVTNGAVVTFDFSEPMCGFGLYLVDYLDFGGDCTWRFFNGATEIASFVVAPIPLDYSGAETLRDGSVGFVGYVSNSTAAPFDSMTMTFSATASDRTGFDNIFVATLAGRPTLAINVGETVQFTDTSEGTVTSWLWNFGDGTTSTLQNPTKTYGASGTYTITLTVNGTSVATRTNYIVVS